MSLLVLDRVSLFFGDRAIVEGLGLRVAEQDRIGIVGPNGSGKTTLLRLVAGQQEPDKGSITRATGVRIGYLPQDIAVAGGQTLIDFVLSSVPGRTELDAQLLVAEAELERLGHVEPVDEELMMSLAQRIADAHERIDHFDRFYTEHEALQILAGLGFEDADRTRDLGEFSGGWKMRAVLSALLFQQPDILLLDEPTNHLDMPSVAWFSAFLKSYRRSFLLISHDREFLDEQIERVVSFESEGVRQYAGNYEKYVKQREEEEVLLINKAKNIGREREQMERFVERFRAQANKAKAVQSRVKALAKMESVQLYQRRRVMSFTFPPTERAVGEVVRIEGLEKRFGDHVVFPGIDLTIRRGEKIGIIGVNGAGKTTLLKMIAGELEASGGAIKIGSKVKVGYYAQHHADTLNEDWTVFEEVSRANQDASIGRVRSVLGAFLYSGDDVDKPVRILSGGERARVALARLLINPGNLLLMDEPTNHLDLASAESLAQSLASYDGTIVFVSHNRSLIRSLATRIWNIEHQAVETYGGTLDEYLFSSAQRLGADMAPAPVASKASKTSKASTAQPGGPSDDAPKRKRSSDRDRKREEASRRKRRHQLIGPLEKRIASLEDRISKLEVQQKQRGEELSDPAVYDDAERRNNLLSAYQKASDKLEQLTTRWEAAVEELERAEQTLAEAAPQGDNSSD